VELAPVPRVTRGEFRPSRWGGEPQVVVDVATSWRALHRWRPEYLKSVIGDRAVVVRETNGAPRNIFQNLAVGGSIRFPQYLDWVLETAGDLAPIAAHNPHIGGITKAVAEFGFESSYYLDVKLERLSRTLLDDIEIPNWYRTAPVDINLWCGVLGTSSGLHCDVTPNCNVQIAGHKTFILFAPSQSRRVYQVPGITHGRFDPNLPDYDRFPLARAATGRECTLKPGEALYIPVGWYHQVTVRSGWALNVNFFWPRPFPQGLLRPSLWHFLLRRGWARTRRAARAAAGDVRRKA
jgi:hypothetical protein